MFEEVNDNKELIVEKEGEIQAEIIINYENKLTQKTHKTVRLYKAQYFPTAPRDPVPFPKGDYWD